MKDKKQIQLFKRDVKAEKTGRLTREGFIPAVVYNNKGESSSAKLPLNEAIKLVRGVTTSTIVDVELGEKKLKALLKEVQTDPRKNDLVHISFFELDETEEMSFEIPFEITGIAPAVKNNLGVLVKPLNAITVKCTLKDVVEHIEVDISNLNEPGDSIEVGDIKLPTGVELIHEDDARYTIVSITTAQKVEDLIEAVEPVEGAEGEVVEGEAAAEGEEKTEE